MKKTPWFKGETKPIHIGVYETKHPLLPTSTTYQHWNGNKWGRYRRSPELAQEAQMYPSDYQRQPWRGLAKKPK